MALNTGVVHDTIDDFIALLPEVKNVLAEKGRNIGDDITTVEHVAEAVVNAAARIGVPYASTAQAALPIAHQIMGVFATWFQTKTFTAAAAAATGVGSAS
jgi:hypothetical protein